MMLATDQSLESTGRRILNRYHTWVSTHTLSPIQRARIDFQSGNRVKFRLKYWKKPQQSWTGHYSFVKDEESSSNGILVIVMELRRGRIEETNRNKQHGLENSYYPRACTIELAFDPSMLYMTDLLAMTLVPKSVDPRLKSPFDLFSDNPQEPSQPLYRDLDFAIGSMTDGEAVDDALKEFSSVDQSMWS